MNSSFRQLEGTISVLSRSRYVQHYTTAFANRQQEKRQGGAPRLVPDPKHQIQLVLAVVGGLEAGVGDVEVSEAKEVLVAAI